MKQITKKQFAILSLVLLLVSSVLVPLSASAKNSVLGAICPNIDSLQNIALDKLESLTTSVAQKRLVREKTFIENRNTQDIALQKLRVQADIDIDALVAKLAATATTKAQKDAIAKFKVDALAALNTRRTALDGALAESRIAIDTLLQKRHAQVEDAKNILANKVSTIISETKTDCLTGKIDLLGSNSLIQKVQDARRVFLTSVAPSIFQNDLAKIDAVKKARIDAAQEVYGNKVAALLVELKSRIK